MSFLTRTVVCTIQNNSDQLLTRKSGHLSHGEWMSGFPPDYIKAGAEGSWSSQTAGLFTGVEGVAQYSLPDGSVFEVRWDNPYVGANSFSQIKTPNGDQGTAPVSDDDPHADDLKVTFVLGPLTVPVAAAASVPPPIPTPPAPEVPAVHDVVADCRNTTHVSKPSRYDRCAAVEYAKKYWDRTTSDGFVGVLGRTGYLKVEPEREFDADNNLPSKDGQPAIKIEEMEDCTHFTSCCIGRPFDAAVIRPLLDRDPEWKAHGGIARAPRVRAGGLEIRRSKERQLGDPWVYGELSAPALVELLRNGFIKPLDGMHLMPTATPADLERMAQKLQLLQPGDLIVKYIDANRTPNAPPIKAAQHVMLYLGEGVYAAHTISRFGVAFPIAWGETIWYTFLRILD